MIPNTKNRVLASSGVEASAEFGISMNDSAHLMTILRDTLYSDKVLAVIREYSANAWDSHRDSGKSELPISVTIPTEMDPTLSIRDFGNGMTQQEVFHLFSQYGASSKRTSDNSVGMLGIGSKSGFAYSDSFTITAWREGLKKTYVAVLDKSEKGLIQLLHEEPCGEETGIMIQLAVRPSDIEEFKTKAQTLFRYFQPRPTINLDIPELPTSQKTLKSGVIYDTEDTEYSSQWVAVMGCISYRINLSQLTSSLGEHGEKIPEFLSKLSGALYFGIGEVQISASREELKYSDDTKKVLVERFNTLVDEYVTQTLAEIQGGNFSPWEKRVRAQVLGKLGLPVPKTCSKDLVAGSVPVPTDKESKDEPAPKTFSIYRDKHIISNIQIQSTTRLIIRDDFKSIKGYWLGQYDYVIRKAPGKVTWDVARVELDALIEKIGLTGITIVKMSEMQWHAPMKSSGSLKGPSNPKHRTRTFKLKRDLKSHGNLSDYWQVEDREPLDTDVFVILEKFRSLDGDVVKRYREDLRLGKKFGFDVPDIYGYKNTDKKPVDEEDCKGTTYNKWREAWLKSLITDRVKEEMEHYYWSKAIPERSYYGAGDDRGSIVKLVKHIGLRHPITEFVRKVFDARKNYRDEDSVLKVLIEKFPIEKPQAEVEYRVLMDKYQLLDAGSEGTIRYLWGSHAEKWAHYILVSDEVTEKEEENHVQLAAVQSN